jgi:hypothetical protein
VRDLSLAWDYWKVFKPVRVGAKYKSSDLWRQEEKTSREFNGPYSTSPLLLPTLAFVVLPHHMLLTL